jgi:hypothetical protein
LNAIPDGLFRHNKRPHPCAGFHPISFGVGLFHFLLTRSRQHRGVAFSLGGGVHPSAKTKAATSSPPVAAFFANPVNLARLRRHIPAGDLRTQR